MLLLLLLLFVVVVVVAFCFLMYRCVSVVKLCMYDMIGKRRTYSINFFFFFVPKIKERWDLHTYTHTHTCTCTSTNLETSRQVNRRFAALGTISYINKVCVATI